MKVLVCGDRNWTDEGAIRATLIKLGATEVIHGACRGADRLGAAAAISLGLGVTAYPAMWNLYGKGAGPIRNQEMLNDGKPDIVAAFHNNITSSRGTRDMIRRSKAAGVETTLIASF